MNIISSDMQTNEQKLLGTKSKQIVNALKILEMLLFLGFLKQLKKEDKLKSDNIENELSKYMGLNKSKLRYITVKNCKNNLESLKELKKIRINQRTRNK